MGYALDDTLNLILAVSALTKYCSNSVQFGDTVANSIVVLTGKMCCVVHIQSFFIDRVNI